MEPDIRDAVVDFIRDWAEKTGLAIDQLLEWLALSVGKFYQWRQRYGSTNQHNGRVPRDFWLQDWEKKAILDFQELYPSEGYRRLTYMMIDHDLVAVSPSSVFRVLSEAGRLRNWNPRPSKKGTVSSSRWSRTSIGILISRTSIFTAPSTTCARCWTGPAGIWWRGPFVSR